MNYQQKKLVFVKLGGSLITDKYKPYTAKQNTINKLAESIGKIISANKDTAYIIGNGAGSYGHYAATQYSHRTPFGFSFIQQKVKDLNSKLIDALLMQKIPSISIPFSSISIAKDSTSFSVYQDSLLGYLETGIIPVVYGDVVYDSANVSTIFSTEKIFSVLIEKLRDIYRIDRVIHLTVVDGLLDENGVVIPRVTNANFNTIKKHLFKTEGFDVTGGMLHKIEESLALAKSGIKTHIVNGRIDDVLLRILMKKESIGTEISSE